MQREVRVHLPRRQVRKVTMTLPVDTIEFLDVCAAGIGQDRSGFLSLFIDGFYEEISAFAKGYAKRIVDQAALTEQNREDARGNSF